MLEQKCALCEKNYFQILYKENFDVKQVDEKTFSARRLPDRLHYRIVQCRKCGLIYSNRILDQASIEKLYKKSLLNYDEQIPNLTATYGFYLRQLEKFRVRKGRLLEIGCGNGFFLEEALVQGYREVYGVEPSQHAVSKASPSVKNQISSDVFRQGLYKKNFFDVICCFQTLDHVMDPNSLLDECHAVLKPGGLVLFLNHDVEALPARILKDKSPIIDIEHTYLYSQKTMKALFLKHGFEVLRVATAFNIHSLGYWLRLIPLPHWLKLPTLQVTSWLKIKNWKIKIYPGNLVLFARK